MKNGKGFCKKCLYRSSHRRRSVNEGVLKNFANLTRKHLCWNLFLINLFIKKLQDRYFLVKFAKFLRKPILKDICRRLLLSLLSISISRQQLFLENLSKIPRKQLSFMNSAAAIQPVN